MAIAANQERPQRRPPVETYKPSQEDIENLSLWSVVAALVSAKLTEREEADRG